MVSLRDPVGDTVRAVVGLRSDSFVRASAPWVDLTEVRLAASPSRFCVDFRTVSPPRVWTRLSVAAFNPRLAANEPIHDINPAIDYSDQPLPEVEWGADGAVSGQVGTSGAWTSLLITSSDAGLVGATFLRAAFEFTAYAEYNPHIPGRSLLVLDRVPDGHAAYP